MTMLVEKPTRAEIAVYYSTARKAEMKMYGEKNCSALFTRFKDIISRHNVMIEKVLTPSDSNRQVDFIITVKAPSPKELDELIDEVHQIKYGVNKITVFPLSTH